MPLSPPPPAVSMCGFGSWPLLDTAVVAEEVAIPCCDSWMYVEDTDVSGVNPLRFQNMDNVIRIGSSSPYFF